VDNRIGKPLRKQVASLSAIENRHV
jgi:hypothetical protein